MTGEERERDPRKININVEKEEINAVTKGEEDGIRDRSADQKGIEYLALIKSSVIMYRFQISVIYLSSDECILMHGNTQW